MKKCLFELIIVFDCGKWFEFFCLVGFLEGPQQQTAMLPIRAASKSCLTEFTQRVMSGKLLQLKQYQNQLNEAINQLHVAREENKALTRLLKRHETSLKRSV